MWPIRVVAILCSVWLSACEPGTGPGNDDGLGSDLDSDYGTSLDGLADYGSDMDMPMPMHGGPLSRGGKLRSAASMSSFHLTASRSSADAHRLSPAGVTGFGEDIMCGWSGP